MGSDLDRQIDTLLQCKIITEAEVKELCLKAREILVEESNVQRVDAPVTVRFFLLFLWVASNGMEGYWPTAHFLTADPGLATHAMIDR